MWWVGLGWLPGAHPAALSRPLLHRTGGEKKKKLVGQDKDTEIAYHLPSQAKPTQLGED